MASATGTQAGDEMADVFRWFNDIGCAPDIERLAHLGIVPTSFGQSLEASETWRPAHTATR